ncbi:ACP phosphodiesterase [Methylonatrum kenyense]|uniref:acyl carrier protein phosphodiesterase n=1 Tax=Methylonatrum kenyense TaxID=455253 RepID=UPI0020BF6319|nr:ACP phosphodiesterase [Methylonatrum kenyense]MCK8516443.1 ACP phosphodiesterase [Methylonatrum kenyense]
MNYLGHLYFSDSDGLHRLGNLGGDWIKGRIEGLALPRRMLDGVRRHRWIDATTDHHPLLRDAHRLFSPHRRRAVPIILDVVFDHLLIHDWNAFARQPLDAFLDGCYADLEATREYWPAAGRGVLDSLVRRQWLENYQDPAVVAASLERIGTRLRRDIGLHGTESEIRAALPALRPLHRRVMRDLHQSLADAAQDPVAPYTEQQDR